MFETTRTEVRRLLDRLHISSIAAFNKFSYFDEIRALELTTRQADATLETTETSFTLRFLTREEILRFQEDKTLGMDRPFVTESLQNEDLCFAALDGDKLASYSWYSNKSTQFTKQFKVHFGSEYTYMHHSFTTIPYRGQRLHTIGILHALRQLSNRSHTKFLAFVSTDNLSSRKSLGRSGFREVGRIYIGGFANRYFIFLDSRFKSLNLRISLRSKSTKYTEIALKKRNLRVAPFEQGDDFGGESA